MKHKPLEKTIDQDIIELLKGEQMVIIFEGFFSKKQGYKTDSFPWGNSFPCGNSLPWGKSLSVFTSKHNSAL